MPDASILDYYRTLSSIKDHRRIAQWFADVPARNRAFAAIVQGLVVYPLTVLSLVDASSQVHLVAEGMAK